MIKLIEDLSHNFPDLSILVFSMQDESIYAGRCLQAGAKGYIMKNVHPDKVILALRKILNGEIYVSDKLLTKLIHKHVTKESNVYSSPVDLLSNRELETFQLTGQGLTTQKIAEELNLSVKTVETYIDHIKKKMKFNSSRELFMHAVKFVNQT